MTRFDRTKIGMRIELTKGGFPMSASYLIEAKGGLLSVYRDTGKDSHETPCTPERFGAKRSVLIVRAISGHL